MECPFELPIGKPFESRDYQYSMTDGKGVFRIIIKGSKTQAAYARNAINSHEKLVGTIRNVSCSLAITLLPKLDDKVANNEEIIRIAMNSLEQVLKEAEKPK